MYDNPPSRTIKLSRWEEGKERKPRWREKQQLEICGFASGVLWRHSLLTCKDRRKIWLWRKQWSNKLTTFVVSKFIGQIVWQSEQVAVDQHISSCLCQRLEFYFPTLHSLLFWCLLVYASLGGSEAVLQVSVVKPVDHPFIFDSRMAKIWTSKVDLGLYLR